MVKKKILKFKISNNNALISTSHRLYLDVEISKPEFLAAFCVTLGRSYPPFVGLSTLSLSAPLTVAVPPLAGQSLYSTWLQD